MYNNLATRKLNITFWRFLHSHPFRAFQTFLRQTLLKISCRQRKQNQREHFASWDHFYAVPGLRIEPLHTLKASKRRATGNNFPCSPISYHSDSCSFLSTQYVLRISPVSQVFWKGHCGHIVLKHLVKVTAHWLHCGEQIKYLSSRHHLLRIILMLSRWYVYQSKSVNLCC